MSTSQAFQATADIDIFAMLGMERPWAMPIQPSTVEFAFGTSNIPLRPESPANKPESIEGVEVAEVQVIEPIVEPVVEPVDPFAVNYGERNYSVSLGQEFVALAKDGGFAALQNVDISAVDGHAGPKTNASVNAITGENKDFRTAEEMGASIRQQLEGNPELRQAVAKSLRSQLVENPEYVSGVLDEYGTSMPADDLEGLKVAIEDFENKSSEGLISLKAARVEHAQAVQLQEHFDQVVGTPLDMSKALLNDVTETRTSIGTGREYEIVVEDRSDGISETFFDGKEAKQWADRIENSDLSAEEKAQTLAQGAYTLGKDGELYHIRQDAEQGLQRLRIDEYVGEHGVQGELNVAEGSLVANRIENAFETMKHTYSGFDSQAGLVMEMKNGVQIRVFDGPDGQRQMNVVGADSDPAMIAKASEQTPAFIENIDDRSMGDLKSQKRLGKAFTEAGFNVEQADGGLIMKIEPGQEMSTEQTGLSEEQKQAMANTPMIST